MKNSSRQFSYEMKLRLRLYLLTASHHNNDIVCKSHGASKEECNMHVLERWKHSMINDHFDIFYSMLQQLMRRTRMAWYTASWCITNVEFPHINQNHIMGYDPFPPGWKRHELIVHPKTISSQHISNEKSTKPTTYAQMPCKYPVRYIPQNLLSKSPCRHCHACLSDHIDPHTSVAKWPIQDLARTLVCAVGNPLGACIQETVGMATVYKMNSQQSTKQTDQTTSPTPSSQQVCQNIWLLFRQSWITYIK